MPAHIIQTPERSPSFLDISTSDSLLEMSTLEEEASFSTPKKPSLSLSSSDKSVTAKVEIDILNDDTTKSTTYVDDEDNVVDDSNDDEVCCRTLFDACSYYFEFVFVRHKDVFIYFFYILLCCLYIAYLTAAIIYSFEGAIFLITITSCVILFACYYFISQKYGMKIFNSCIKPIVTILKKRSKVLKCVFFLICFAGLMIFLILDVALSRPKQLMSLVGLGVLLACLFIFSKHPKQVRWRPVIWGLVLQFIFALLILKWSWGYIAFMFLGEQIHIFFDYSDVGAKFLFGEMYMNHFFAFKVLPVIIYFSCFISILYYLGVMQAIIGKIAWLMQKTMGTTGPESVNAAGNIFVGQTEAPLLIAPFLKDMTKSELHAVMTGGFATIAGTVMAAYIVFKIPPIHLISASVMAAPAALAVSKLFYPETKESKMKNIEDLQMTTSEHRNLIEAASAGASNSISLVANIAANLIAFLAMLALFNAILSYLGSRVGYPELSFKEICSYIFTPLAFLMGINWEDCRIVAELLGIKTFINEFVAYEQLSVYINNRQQGIYPHISERSEAIATYALCSFANLSSVGIQLGGIGAMIPHRKGELAELAVRALIAGTITSYMTACIAGLLISDSANVIEFNSTLHNMTLDLIRSNITL